MMMDSEEEEEQTALVCDNGKLENAEIQVARQGRGVPTVLFSKTKKFQENLLLK